MKRLFWVVLGAALGVITVRRVTKNAEAFSPAGIASSVGSLTDSVRDFAADVRDGMHAREQELLAGTGLDGTLGARSEDFE